VTVLLLGEKKTYFGVGQCYNVRKQLTRGLAVKLKRENVNINNMNCSVPSKYNKARCFLFDHTAATTAWKKKKSSLNWQKLYCKGNCEYQYPVPVLLVHM
jgi:hypothetical protein